MRWPFRGKSSNNGSRSPGNVLASTKHGLNPQNDPTYGDFGSEASQLEGNDHHHSIGLARFHMNPSNL
jgi:hypothetical protein